MLQGSPSGTSEGFRRAGEFLSALIYAADPLRMDSEPPPSLDLPIQEAFLDTFYTNLSFLEAHITANDGAPCEIRGKQEIPLLLRLLQFELSFQNTWSVKTKEVTHKISSLLFNLALVSGTSC